MKFLVKQIPNHPARIVNSEKILNNSPYKRSMGPYIYFSEIKCGGSPDFYNEQENVRPMSQGTDIALSTMDGAIKALEDTLAQMKTDRAVILERGYNDQNNRIYFNEDGTWKVEALPGDGEG